MDTAPGSVWPRFGASLPRAVQLAGQVQLLSTKGDGVVVSGPGAVSHGGLS